MGTLDSVPLKFKVTTCCTRLSSLPDGVQSVSPPPRSTPLHSAPLRSTPLHSAPLDPLAPRDASSPVPHTAPSIASSDSESVTAYVPSSAAAASALSRATFQSTPVCSHHLQATRAPCRLVEFSHRSRIGRVAINCATVFCLRRIDVQIQTIPASFIAPASEG